MPVSPARKAAFDILLRVERRDAYASELLHSSRIDQLSPVDRGLVTEVVMGVLRWRSRLDHEIAAAAGRQVQKLDAEVLAALRMGTYQLRYLDRIPAHAAINDSVELVKRARKTSAAPFVNAVLRKLAAINPTCAKSVDEWGTPTSVTSTAENDTTRATLAREFAHPVWLVERWAIAFGLEHTAAICRHDQHVAETVIRVEAATDEAELRDEGIELAPGALVASARIVAAGEITRTPAFREGRVFIQDEASQLVALLVGAGSRLLDCCAAPGGKTAALAARNPTAQIIAAEIHAHRAHLLRERVRAANVEVINVDALALPSSDQFDRVLADVPCSGTGTLARNPEIKWRLEPEELIDLHARQVAILRAALRQLAPGGRAVYSTCSLEREECEEVIDEALGGDPGYTLIDCRDELERLRAAGELAWPDLSSLISGAFLRTIPGVHPCDGFFAALIERSGS